MNELATVTLLREKVVLTSASEGKGAEVYVLCLLGFYPTSLFFGDIIYVASVTIIGSE